MARLIFTCLSLCVTAIPACAADAARSNALTPTEAAEGWLLLFDGDTTFGWRIVQGELGVEDGALLLGGSKETIVGLEFGYFEMSWEWRWDGPQAPRRTVHATKAGEAPAGSDAELDQHRKGKQPQWLHERWRVQGDDKTASSNNRKFSGDANRGFLFETTTSFQPGRHIRVTLNVPAGTRLWLRNLKLKPLGLQPIFNGKDVTGWKEFPGRKSKFTVTDKGELNVKDGPGDLQTEGQWDDFVLQLECISNGKHLNSGVFFRCIPGQYQQGYEAQIRNQWERDDRAKPVDFGTGAIYRRQPARKVVSSDNEWFTMMIVARGNRLCVWVNGYPVTDFVDDRPPNDNARNGAKTGKGAISIQGHDPTTDLSFRNIRIAELAKAGEK